MKNNDSYFLVTIFTPIVQLHLLHLNIHTTHNSSMCSDEGLTLKTSALKLFWKCSHVWPNNCNLQIDLNYPRKSSGTGHVLAFCRVDQWDFARFSLQKKHWLFSLAPILVGILSHKSLKGNSPIFVLFVPL